MDLCGEVTILRLLAVLLVFPKLNADVVLN